MKIWIFKTPISLLASLIWNFSEYIGVGLGRFAPIVFHLMIGAKDYKKVNKTETNL